MVVSQEKRASSAGPSRGASRCTSSSVITSASRRDATTSSTTSSRRPRSSPIWPVTGAAFASMESSTGPWRRATALRTCPSRFIACPLR